jgi:hypothetical protein
MRRILIVNGGSHREEVVMVALLIFVNYVLTLFLIGGALTGRIDPTWSVIGLVLLIWGEYRVYRRDTRSAHGTLARAT